MSEKCHSKINFQDPTSLIDANDLTRENQCESSGTNTRSLEIRALVRSKKLLVLIASLVAVTFLSVTWAQYRGWNEPRMPDRSEFPVWEHEPAFKSDVFTFARIEYTSHAGGRGNRWRNDFPDSDWNFSYRLQQLTSLKVDPNGIVLKLTDPVLFDYPFLYMNGIGSIELARDEANALRRHLLNGGFLMVDDFWGEDEWAHLMDQMRHVFPDRSPIELPLSHEIFHIVYDLKTKPQVPDIRTWRSGLTFEENHGRPGDRLPHFQAYYDDFGRIVALLCHNNDLGDGWEREGENADYFATFAVPFSYPMGINIIAYAMTH